MKLRAKKAFLPKMEQAKPAMKAEINLFRTRDKNSRSNFAMNSALIRDISGRERLNFIDIILSFMCMGLLTVPAIAGKLISSHS